LGHSAASRPEQSYMEAVLEEADQAMESSHVPGDPLCLLPTQPYHALPTCRSWRFECSVDRAGAAPEPASGDGAAGGAVRSVSNQFQTEFFPSRSLGTCLVQVFAGWNVPSAAPLSGVCVCVCLCVPMQHCPPSSHHSRHSSRCSQSSVCALAQVGVAAKRTRSLWAKARVVPQIIAIYRCVHARHRHP
jgi:hypothetical protein